MMKPLIFTVFYLFLVVFGTTAEARDVWKNIDRIVVVGDLHGDFDAYREILLDNGLIDEQLKWQGGETHFVQLGDVTDRGPDSRKIIEHLMQLERSAKKAGGYVHVLIGNHEMMNITGDLRYVHPGEYASFAGRNARSLQQQYIEAVLAWQKAQTPDQPFDRNARRVELQDKYPLGYVEHRRAWSKGGTMYNWFTKKNSAIKINNLLFVHAGINPHVEPSPLKKLNRQVQKALRKPPSNTDEFDAILFDDGPLWYRGLAQGSEQDEQAPLDQLLSFYGVDRVIVGHTPSLRGIDSRLNGKVILADTGISSHYGGPRTSLIIEKGEIYVIHEGTKLSLPKSAAEKDQYLQQLKSLTQAKQHVGSHP